jgi:hypothetical protein
MTSIRKRESQRHCFGAAIAAVCPSDDLGLWQQWQELQRGTGFPP